MSIIVTGYSEPHQTGWPWPLSAVQGWFETLWNDVTGWFRGLWDKIWGGLVWVGDRLKEIASNIVDRVWGFFIWLRDQIAGIIAGIPGALAGIVKAVSDWISPFFKTIGDTIWNTGRWIFDSISGALRDLPGKIWEGAKWIGGEISKAWEDAKKAVWGFFQDQWGKIQKAWEDAKNAIWGFFGDLWGKIQRGWGEFTTAFDGAVRGFVEYILKGADAIASAIEKWADKIASGIEKGTSDLAPNILKALSDFWSFLDENVFKPIGKALEEGFKWLSNAIKSAISVVWETLKSMAPRSPEGAIDSAIGVLGILGVSGLGIGVMTVLGELVHPLKEMGLGQLSAFIYDMAGYKVIASALVGAFIGATIRIPLGYELNALFRPYIPEPKLADDMYFEGNISEEEWYRIYGYHGWKQHHAEAWFKTMDREPSTYDLIRIADSTEIDETWSYGQLAESNYRPTEIEHLLEAIRRRPVMDEIKMFRSELIRAYASGDLSKGELVGGLAETFHKPAETAILLKLADLLYRKELIKKLIAIHIAAYHKDQETESELRDNVMGLLKDPDRVNAIVTLERLKKLKLPKDPEVEARRGKFSSTVVSLYEDGYLEETGLNEYIAMLDYNEVEKGKIMIAAQLGRDLEIKRDQTTAGRLAYRAGVVDEEGLGNWLLGIPMTQDRVDSIVEVEYFRKLGKKKPKKEAAA